MRRTIQLLLVVVGAGALAGAGCSSAADPSRAAAPTAVASAPTSPGAGPGGGIGSGTGTGANGAAGGAGVATDVVEDRPGVTLPARWPADLPRPDGAALQESSAASPAGADGNGPPGDWALFVVPQAQAPAVSGDYATKLRAAGLGVDQSTVDAGGQEAVELRVAVTPLAVARVLQVGPSAVVTVTLAPA